MSLKLPRIGRPRIAAALLAALAAVVTGTLAYSGGFIQNQRSVGGVSVDVNGVLDNVDAHDRAELKKVREAALKEVPGDLKKAAKLRYVSLRRLEETIAKHLKNPAPLPDDIVYLAGLTRIQYVLVLPEQKDIVLAGPAEGWKAADAGHTVGITSGQPVMLLDDLLVALRTADSARTQEISCSINAQEEGLAKYRAFMAKQTTAPADKGRMLSEIEKALGPQKVTLTGVPPSSHFARVLVAADFRMKRIAMGLEPAPIKGLPSYLDMLTGGKMTNAMPRWWMVPNYEPLAKDPDGLAWEIGGQGVKTMSEEEFLGADDKVTKAAAATGLARKWSDKMTEKYPELVKAEPIFGQLRNCMDLAVAAALIRKERLDEKAGFKMSLLLDKKELLLDQFDVPKQIASKASAIKKGSNWIFTASGGVTLNSWEVADKVKESTSLAGVREKATGGKDAWWWE